MNIDRNEVLRYMKVLPEKCTPELDSQITEAIVELHSLIRPRHIYERYDCNVMGTHLSVGSMEIDSQSLSKHLAVCSEAVLMAATLGHEADQLLRRLSIMDMGKAVIMQAVSVATIEAYCDQVEAEIIDEAQRLGYKTKWRFSPGYGDFSIEHQKDFFRMLNCPKTTGMTLTDTLMMNPVKSVTAIIGLYKEG
jgi:hypothetical protein